MGESSALETAFVPLVTVVGFHHARYGMCFLLPLLLLLVLEREGVFGLYGLS